MSAAESEDVEIVDEHPLPQLEHHIDEGDWPPTVLLYDPNPDHFDRWLKGEREAFVDVRRCR